MYFFIRAGSDEWNQEDPLITFWKRKISMKDCAAFLSSLFCHLSLLEAAKLCVNERNLLEEIYRLTFIDNEFTSSIVGNIPDLIRNLWLESRNGTFEIVRWFFGVFLTTILHPKVCLSLSLQRSGTLSIITDYFLINISTFAQGTNLL